MTGSGVVGFSEKKQLFRVISEQAHYLKEIDIKAKFYQTLRGFHLGSADLILAPRQKRGLTRRLWRMVSRTGT